MLRALFTSSSIALATALALQPGTTLAQDVPGDPATGGDAQAQQQQPQPDPADPVEEDLETIVVVGSRLAGQVDAPQPPVLELDEADIAAYGAGSIAELIEALGPQVSSGRGRGGGGGPIILVNGVRISSFRELASYPPEAIERTEVFSEEVAQQYGYSPDSRVVNIVLKDDFSSREIEVEYGQPFDGGYSTQEAEATYLRIDGDSRLNLNLEWQNASGLTEAERGVIQADGSVPTYATDPDPAQFRSLVADTAGVEGTVNWTTGIGAGNSLSLSAAYQRDDSLRLQGLDTVLLTDPAGATALRSFNAADPLTVERRNNTWSGGSTLNVGIGEWQLTGTADASFGSSRTLIDRRYDGAALQAAAAAGQLALDGDLGAYTFDGFDEALSDTYRVSTLVTARGQPIYLPAGDVSVTLDAGFVANGLESTDTRNPGLVTDLSRERWSAGANVSVPLTARDEFLGAVGDITLNLQAGVDHLSDFGTLYDWSPGLTWGITDTLTLSATYIYREEAPSLTELGGAQVVTPNVPVFDLARNETVLAEVVSGGNPDLPAQSQSDWKFGVNWQLPFMDNASLQVEYFDNHAENIAQGLPFLTPEIEAAFPGRVTRDASGRIVRVDERFVTFAAQDTRRLQVGLNFSGQIGGDEDEGETRGGGGGTRAPAAAAPPGAQGSAQGAGQGSGRGGMDPARFQAMRETFCAADPATLIEQMNAAIAAAANGTEPPLGPDGQPLAIPPQMLARLTAEDGRIDPERFAQVRERVCSADAAQFAGRGPGAPGAPGADGPPPGAGTGGPPPGAGQGGGSGRGPGGGGGGGRGFGGGGFGRFGGGPGGGGSGGRWFANLQYAHEFENTVLIAEGLPELDLLEGDALSGAIPRDTFNLRAGAFYQGFGLIGTASYRGASRIEGSGLPGGTDLFFGDIATVNLRAFVDLGQQESLVEDVPFFEGTRLGFAVSNLFDARQRVIDNNGEVPLRYQPFLIDPVGRSFEIEFRKLF